jgi:tRNA pseudouridine55 synthase
MPENTIGFFIIDKPPHLTSHDVVSHIRHLTGIHQVGHTGTLDPFATGILLIPIGAATRLTAYTHSLPKAYSAQITLGATTDTDDLTGTLEKGNSHQPTLTEIKTCLEQFKGEIQQLPPSYAAIKIKGKKLYEYARQGKEVERKPRAVTIHALDITSYTYPHITITTTVSSGTYIRALARDIGRSLTTGAYLTTLRRTSIGEFTEKNAVDLHSLTAENWPTHLHNAHKLVSHLPHLILNAANVAKLQQGREVATPDSLPSGYIAMLNQTDQLIGIGTANPQAHTLSPKVIFPQ